MKRFILVGTAILVIAGLYTGKTMAKNRVSAYVDKDSYDIFVRLKLVCKWCGN